MSDPIALFISTFCTAFELNTVGTKVTEAKRTQFLKQIESAIANTDFDKQECAGQASILVNHLVHCVTSGVGVRTKNPNDYIPRLHRGQMELFLKRERAMPAENCTIIVYTRAAYLADPQVASNSEETAMIQTSNTTHVLVAVLADAGPHSTVSPHRFVQNLAGGNNQYKAWDAERIQLEASKVKAYHDLFCTVADEN